MHSKLTRRLRIMTIMIVVHKAIKSGAARDHGQSKTMHYFLHRYVAWNNSPLLSSRGIKFNS